MTLQEIQSTWKDNKETHKLIAETLYHKTNEVPILKELRDFIETNTFGHGERCFYWMWKLIIDEMPSDFNFLEIGVHKGQILALVKILSDRAEKTINRAGISPMNGAELNIDSDYYADIKKLHDLFGIKNDISIIEGMSTDPKVIEVSKFLSLDILYIDGGHDYKTVKSDIENYLPLIKSGGYLVIDDACNEMDLPEGYFGGIESVTKAVLDAPLPNEEFKFLFSVGHNKVFLKR